MTRVSDASVRASRDTPVRGGFGTLLIVIRYLSKISARGKSTDISSGHTGSSRASSGRPPPGSLALASRQADLDPPGRHLGVLLLADEVDLGGADVGVAGEFAHLVHRGPVADGVVDRRLA